MVDKNKMHYYVDSNVHEFYSGNCILTHCGEMLYTDDEKQLGTKDICQVTCNKCLRQMEKLAEK